MRNAEEARLYASIPGPCCGRCVWLEHPRGFEMWLQAFEDMEERMGRCEGKHAKVKVSCLSTLSAMQTAFCAGRSLMQDAAGNRPWDGRSGLMFWKGAMTHPERETTVKSQLLQQSGMTQVHFVNFSASETYVSLPGHCHHK